MSALSANGLRGQHRQVSENGGHIHLILPDPTERAACFRVLAAGSERIVRSFASADAWIEAEGGDSCAILLFHWRQPGATDGAALLDHVTVRGGIAAFVAAEQLSIAESRAILRGGAQDLLPAPLDPRLVRRTIDAALADWRARQGALDRRREAEARLAALTPRERDILDAIAAGLGNKAIARQLALSPRTVEVHRANIMRRAGAGNVAELLRLQFIAEFAGAASIDSVRFGA
ncbi:LuxR family transcriptional regulator [Sphingopyxis fribergensis]|uniref:LuxR family transcriptional regulator n=1 Tax=Sphingopyxis fribergensis TaxID=1515612 RepID=A0A0A7PMD4_9SPHN|nr:LuxR C-terminal-related transcriptional regulator [Sphingopyxis fribergensis]AJA11154.1 LuxR family transcriptional regulator [Sphingopyxis fribergensis]